MRLLPSVATALALVFPWASRVAAVRVFQSRSLEVCQDDSAVTASLFNVVFTPDNQTLTVKVQAESTMSGNFTFKISAAAYGYTFLRETLNPCTYEGLTTLCPLDQVEIGFDETFANISTSLIGHIPGIAYTIPDLDAVVTVNMYMQNDLKKSLACLKIRLANGKTVNQLGVKWVTAIIAIIGLLASAIVSGLGHSNTAAHVSLYATALFSYFQNIGIIGFTAVYLPPIVVAWTQDFVWSLGVIRVTFLQQFARWYLRATGGKPTSILTTLGTKSVQVAKRSLGENGRLVEAAHSLYKRTQNVASAPGGAYIVSGIQRVAFLAPMEPTNLFLTCVIFYCIFVIFTLLVIWLFRFFCGVAIKLKWMQSQNNRFQDFHDHWRIMTKGTIFRLILIGYPPMMIVSLWEFTVVDSPAEVVLAILFFFGMSGALGLAAFHVITLAQRSHLQHHTHAYLLYTNAITLRKWGFLFIQFRASAYWYIVPTLSYIVTKAFFIGLAQKSGLTQAIALIIIEGAALIGVSVFRPFMDKTSNTMGIAICAVQFINAVFLLIFTDVFDGPGLLIGVCGMVFFFLNIIFSLVLLIIVLVASTLSIVRSDPETRYQPMEDNRGSFIKSQTALTTELDMLAATARGAGDLDYNKEARDVSVLSMSHAGSHSPFGDDHSLRHEEAGWRPPMVPSRVATPRLSSSSDAPSFRQA